MSDRSFVLRLDAVSGADIGVAAWTSLMTSAWAIYHSMVLLRAATSTDGASPSIQERLRFARIAFTQVASELPIENQFRTELLRYFDEIVISKIGESTEMESLPN